MPEWQIDVRDSGLVRRGLVHTFIDAEFVLRFNRAGSWKLVIPADQDAAALLVQRGSGIVVTRDDVRIMSGFTTVWDRERTQDNSLLTVVGLDDTALLDRRLAHPSPADGNFATQAHDVRTGVGETVLRQYVDVNAGPSAIAARRVSGLTLAADQARGDTVTGRARLNPLSDFLRDLALAAGDLGFRIVQDGTAREFQVYETADRTATVKFSVDLGTLAGYQYREQSPDANYVYVGGGGEGVARTIVEGGDSASIVDYGRIEAFRDRRDTTDATELGQQRDTELAEQAQRFGLSLTPIDTQAQAYGVDYGLGDRVTASIDGVAVQDVLREVRFTLKGGEAEELVPTLSSPGEGEPGSAPAVFERVRRLSGRLQNLERR